MSASVSQRGQIGLAEPVVPEHLAGVADHLEEIPHARQVLEIMMPGGGYAFSPSHQLQDNSPTENVLALYETAREYGRY